MSKKEDDSEDNSGCLGSVVFGFFLILLFQWIWPYVIPFTTFEFFTLDFANIARSLWAMIPLFCYGLLLNLPAYLKKEPLDMTKNDFFVLGTKISLWAGIAEEIAFRWILFFSAIITIGIVDWILFGFMFDYGLLGLLYNWIMIPVANFLTAGFLEPWLYHPHGWVIGAAIVSANGQFRNGHAYQGCLGYLTSWFIGMIFFYIMFTSGIFAAMVVHFFYDFVILTVLAITRGR